MTDEDPPEAGESLSVPRLSEANLFDITGPIQINYSRSSLTGQPLLSYKDAERDLTFAGDELHRKSTPIGELVTITVQIHPDVCQVRISLLVPGINVAPGQEVPFDTAIIETVDRSQAHVLPPGPAGVVQTYRLHQVHGTARSVQF